MLRRLWPTGMSWRETITVECCAASDHHLFDFAHLRRIRKFDAWRMWSQVDIRQTRGGRRARSSPWNNKPSAMSTSSTGRLRRHLSVPSEPGFTASTHKNESSEGYLGALKVGDRGLGDLGAPIHRYPISRATL